MENIKIINYKRLNELYCYEVCNLLLDIFKHDEWYKNCSEIELYNIYEDGYDYCCKYGEIYGAFCDDKLIGVSMWFKFTNDVPNFIIPESLQKIIFKYSTSKNIIYRLISGILPKYRNIGIGSELLNIMHCHYPNYEFFTDVINEKWKEKLKMYGYKFMTIWNNSNIMKYIL